jgi:hypothetical protein
MDPSPRKGVPWSDVEDAIVRNADTQIGHDSTGENSHGIWADSKFPEDAVHFRVELFFMLARDLYFSPLPPSTRTTSSLNSLRT